MFDVVGSLQGLLKVNQVSIDNTVFWLHYRMTMCLLVFFSVIVTSYQYVGHPISCVAADARIMNTYCWITVTFSLPESRGKHMAYAGVGPRADDEPRYHNYYQWVCYVLAFQAAMFYVPRFLWKTWEGGRMQMLTRDLLGNAMTIADECKERQLNVIVKYFVACVHMHHMYAAHYILCELLNLANTVVQMYVMNNFLNGHFTTYGWDMLWRPLQSRRDTMDRVFPKVTKCTFNMYGSSGTIQNIDGMCVLALNAVNEYIYMFLWFWLAALAAVSAVQVLFSALTVVCPNFRAFVLARGIPQPDVKTINARFHFGDWLIFYQLSKNVDSTIFQELVAELAAALNGRAPAATAPNFVAITEPDGVATTIPMIVHVNGLNTTIANGTVVATANGTAVAIGPATAPTVSVVEEDGGARNNVVTNL